MKFTVYIPFSAQLLKTKIGLVAKEKGGISQKSLRKRPLTLLGWMLDGD